MVRTLPRVTKGHSVYDVVREHLCADGRLDSKGLALPDDPTPSPDTILWAPGASDGVLGGVTDDSAQIRARTVAEALLAAAHRPTRRALKRLYEALQDGPSRGYVDSMIEHLAAARPDAAAVHAVAVWLATTAAHREPVKVGLALIGVTGLREAGAVVRALGAHDEFTLFAAVAIRNGSPTPDRELWELAKVVDGWGRVQTVERLRGTTDPQIREWILREGFRNSVMYEYLAPIAATTGDLLGALRRPNVDRELLTSAGEIIHALLQGGPAENIGDIEDGPELLDAYLDLLADRAETLTDLQTTRAIEDATGGGDQSDACVRYGWDEPTRARLEGKARRVMALPRWPDVVATGLGSSDPATFWTANQNAPRFGIDTFDLHLERLSADPIDGPWFDAWRAADRPDRCVALVDLARLTFPRAAVVTGPPGRHLGFGPEFRAHNALDWTLQELRHHPGLGGDLLSLGLLSPLVRNRNMALNALKEWPVDVWPVDALSCLHQMAEKDPNEHTRDLAAQILARIPHP